jgi:HPt (histidine-containing phosphotransfer) domain-containing protein
MSGWTAHVAALTAFLAVLVISSAWEMHALRHDSEIRLQWDAETLAKRAGLYLAGITWERDVPAARNAIFMEMEDVRLVGMLIHDREGLLEGMRRNRLWEPVPWDDLTPENSVEASASITMEDVPVGEVVIYLSRRTLNEELAARARRELARLTALALIPCIALALLLWQRAAGRTAYGKNAHDVPSMPPEPVPFAAARHGDIGRERAVASPLQLPPDWHNNEEARQAYLEAGRAFIRTQQAGAAQLCRLTAREDWGELRKAARALREAALAVNARSLAAAALSVQEAALANTASAARRVEHCISVLTQVLNALGHALHNNANAVRGSTQDVNQTSIDT